MLPCHAHLQDNYLGPVRIPLEVKWKSTIVLRENYITSRC